MKREFRIRIMTLLTTVLLLCPAAAVSAAENPVVYNSNTVGNDLHVIVGNLENVQGVSCQVGNVKCENVTVNDTVDLETYILADNSLSIDQKYHETIRQILNALIESTAENEKVTIATFDKQLHYLIEKSSDKEQLSQTAAGITYQDLDTKITDVMYYLCKDLEKDPFDGLRRIILISDGAEYSSVGYTRQEMLAEVQKLCYPVYTVGCTYKNNTKELEDMFSISRMTGAESVWLDELSDVQMIVNTINESHNSVQVEIPIPESLGDGAQKGVKLDFQTADGVKSVSTTATMPFIEMNGEIPSVETESDVQEIPQAGEEAPGIEPEAEIPEVSEPEEVAPEAEPEAEIPEVSESEEVIPEAEPEAEIPEVSEPEEVVPEVEPEVEQLEEVKPETEPKAEMPGGSDPDGEMPEAEPETEAPEVSEPETDFREEMLQPEDEMPETGLEKASLATKTGNTTEDSESVTPAGEPEEAVSAAEEEEVTSSADPDEAALAAESGSAASDITTEPEKTDLDAEPEKITPTSEPKEITPTVQPDNEKEASVTPAESEEDVVQGLLSNKLLLVGLLIILLGVLLLRRRKSGKNKEDGKRSKKKNDVDDSGETAYEDDEDVTYGGAETAYEDETVYNEDETAFNDEETAFNGNKPVYGRSGAVFGGVAYDDDETAFGDEETVFGNEPTVMKDDRTEMLDDSTVMLSGRVNGSVANFVNIRLTDMCDPTKVVEVPLFSVVKIGRNANANQAVFDYDKSVSQQHCEIVRRKGRFYIHDLNSTNGTWVDDEEVDGETEIYSGAVLKIGRLEVIFETV